jgi:hypothetical protein
VLNVTHHALVKHTQVRQIRHVRKMGEAGVAKNKKKGSRGCSLY